MKVEYCTKCMVSLVHYGVQQTPMQWGLLAKRLLQIHSLLEHATVVEKKVSDTFDTCTVSNMLG